MFSSGGPHAWQTSKGHSCLDGMIETARERHLSVKDLDVEHTEGRRESTISQKAAETVAAVAAEHGEKV